MFDLIEQTWGLDPKLLENNQSLITETNPMIIPYFIIFCHYLNSISLMVK